MENYLKELSDVKPIGNGLSLFEIEDPNESDEFHVFHVMQSENYLYVGSISNCGFCYHSHMEKDNDFSLYENLQTLYDAILDRLYNDQEIIGELF